MAGTDHYICTWLFADSEREESTYFQVPARSSSRVFQEAYWRCVAVFFGTSYRQQPGASHLLFTNVHEIPAVDGFDMTTLLARFNVEVVVLPLTFATPPGYYHAYRNQFYVFDIAHYLNSRLDGEGSAVLLDSDCIWIASGGPMRDALERDGVLTYVENYPVHWRNNGLSREEMRQIGSSLLGRELPYPLVYCGGEIMAATGAEFSRLVPEIDVTWRQLMERHARGEPTFNEEGQTLSYIYYKLGYPLGNADPFIRRISTGSFRAYNNALPTDHGLSLWHVPLEKRLGIRRLFAEIVDPDSAVWSFPSERELRDRLGAYVGVHRNSRRKQIRDITRRVVDKVRYRHDARGRSPDVNGTADGAARARMRRGRSRKTGHDGTAPRAASLERSRARGHAGRLGQDGQPEAGTVSAAYVTTGDASDVRAWSGTFYYVARALSAQGVGMTAVGPLETRYETLFKAKEGFFRYLLRRRHPRDREPTIAKHYARQAMSRITADHDLVFGVGTLPISYLECRQPIVVWTDATFASLVDFYPIYTNISAESVRHGNALEKAALERCRLIVYSSDWAAQSAIDDYGIDPARVVVVPFGANMDTDLSEEDAESAVAGRPDDVCKLLFMGVEWERKGGPLAIEIAAELNAAGLPTRLDVVGPWPRGTEPPAFVNPLGFLDKSSPAGRQKLRHLLLGSHFMVLPARADCTPVVLNEAAAHALPALATSVGGIPTIIRNGANGRLFSADADAAEYAAYVIDTLSSQDGYRQLAQASFEEYRLRLNWNVAGKAVRRLLDDALQSA